jgi:hypothetical protein
MPITATSPTTSGAEVADRPRSYGRDLGVPRDLPGLAVERDQPRVERRHQHVVAGDRGAAVDRAAADAEVLRLLVVVAPEDLAGHRVDREQRFCDAVA